MRPRKRGSYNRGIVRPTLIRVDADELTYPCHIILRFELERGLIEGSLQPDDLPDAWDRGMREILGLSTRGNDRDGGTRRAGHVWRAPGRRRAGRPTYRLTHVIPVALVATVVFFVRSRRRRTQTERERG